MAADNSAYDYFLLNNPNKPDNRNDRKTETEEQYKEYSHVQQPKRAPDITMKKIMPKKGSAPKVFLAALAALMVFFSVLYGKVETNKMYRKISDENKKLESLQSENVRLQSELEGKMTLKNVEDYAVNVLGLKKLDNSQIEYVQTQTDDVVEIPEEEKNIFVKIKESFNRFIEYIFG